MEADTGLFRLLQIFALAERGRCGVFIATDEQWSERGTVKLAILSNHVSKIGRAHV